MHVSRAITAIQTFSGENLRNTLAAIESSLRGVTAETYEAAATAHGATSETLQAAGDIKRLVSQINVVVHSVGILLCLPHILKPGEMIESVSLGAGNTGKAFDLETSQRIAEFKFIRWRGGAEAIRQNALFKDFFQLAEFRTEKSKYLYVLGLEHPLKFFNGRRDLSSVLRDHATQAAFFGSLGKQYRTVCEYYQARRDLVEVIDVSPFVPELSEIEISSTPILE
jgi:hypothetical protein